MINRVDAQQSYIAPYDRAGRRTVHKDGDAPAFLLEQDEKGVIYEHGASEDAARDAARKKRELNRRKESSQEKTSSGRSSAGTEKRPQETAEVKTERVTAEKTAEAKAPAFDLSGFLKKTVGRLRAFFGGIVHAVWYGDDAPKQEDGRSTEPVVSAEPDPGRYSDASIRALLAKKDEEGFMDALTEGHTKLPARNTSLLTYYDRRGRIVGPGVSESTRILKGDGSGRDTIRRPQGNYRRFI